MDEWANDKRQSSVRQALGGYADRCSWSISYSSHSGSELYFTQGDNRIGGRYWKARYTEYVDATFAQRKRLSEAEAHLGILGTVQPPVMYWMGERC